MIMQSAAKIFLAEERGDIWKKWQRSRPTFNYDSFNHIHKQAFKSLYLFNDELIAAGHSMNMGVHKATFIVIVPIIGVIAYKDSVGNESMLVSGQLQVFEVPENTVIELQNPCIDETVNFLQFWIEKTQATTCAITDAVPIDLEGNFNRLDTIISISEFAVAIGKLSSKEEDCYLAEKEGNAMFAFLISGSMEIEHRLLQSRDGLGIWDTTQMECEALSSSAIVLIIELKY